jgi:hypothetical protein
VEVFLLTIKPLLLVSYVELSFIELALFFGQPAVPGLESFPFSFKFFLLLSERLELRTDEDIVLKFFREAHYCFVLLLSGLHCG